jgi:mycothiol synthase
MENTFTIRHYVPEQDLTALARLLTEIESIDRDGEDTSEEYLRSMSDWPNFEPDRNAWVAESDDQFVGFGQILARAGTVSPIYVVVHPSERRMGLGSQFLALILRRGREAGSTALMAYPNDRNTASNACLRHHGFALAGTSGVMVAQVDELPRAEIPQGFSLRRYPELKDPQVVVQALDQCYKDMVGHHQNVTSADRYINHYGEEGIHLLFDKSETLIGVCAAKPAGKADNNGASDLLDAPGLIPEHRHRGFQRFLTLAVMSWLREQGTRPITLEYWGDEDDALEIYRGLGFVLVNQQVTYRKELQ